MDRLAQALSETSLVTETLLVVAFLVVIVLVRRTVIGGHNRRSS